MGNTGHSFGAHCHFEVRNLSNVRIDPTPYLDADLPKVVASTPVPAPKVAPTYAIGQHVIFSTCYRTSTDPNSKAIGAPSMARNHGTITKIVPGTKNPYLLDSGLCWVNDGDIRGFYNQEVAPVVSAPTPVVVAPAQQIGTTYPIAKGDTLWALSRKFGVTVAQIQTANPGIVATALRIGQVINIPK